MSFFFLEPVVADLRAILNPFGKYAVFSLHRELTLKTETINGN